MSFPCRSCGAPAHLTFADLGVSPLANAYLEPGDLDAPERFYPLHARVCEACWLVQLPAAATPEEIFSDYAYFSSFATSWVEHARRYAEAATTRLGLGSESLVVEVASNDGYLLQHFAAADIPVLGIEPAANVAVAARERGIPTETRFFGEATAGELVAAGRRADLLVGNNVFAHVPDLHDFTAGLAALLAPEGTLTLEFPHLQRLVEGNQFDTIYHEHFSYFSFLAARDVLGRQGLAVWDVEELPTHGGSLRLWAGHEAAAPPASERVTELAAREERLGYRTPAPYTAFAERVRAAKRDLLRFLVGAAEEGKTVAGYGAPAKGNTLLVYCGVGPDLVAFTVDRSPHKQGRYLPGSRIPILAPEALAERRPDYVLVLPWNLRDEIFAQQAGVREWGGRFVTAIPRLEVHP